MITALIIGQILMAASFAAFIYGNSGGYGAKAVKATGWGLFLLGVILVTDFYVGLA